MLLRFSFDTTLDFTAPVWEHQLCLRCAPMQDARQQLLECETLLEPGTLPPPQVDGFGNTLYWCSINAPHTALHYGSRGLALVHPGPVAAPPPDPVLRWPGARTRVGHNVQQAFAAMPRPEAPDAFLAQLGAYVHGLLTYCPGATGVQTTAEQALAAGRGVCQDYAHLYVALARLAGYPARYCMGLTIGEGATHAWAELYYGGAWHGYDPTRNCPADDSYLRFGVGRDAADCPVEQGVFRGACDQWQTVFMRVEPAGE